MVRPSCNLTFVWSSIYTAIFVRYGALVFLYLSLPFHYKIQVSLTRKKKGKKYYNFVDYKSTLLFILHLLNPPI